MKNRKNIIFLHEGMNFGGAERVLIDILDNFDFDCYDVTLLLLYGGGQLIEQLPPELKVAYVFKNSDEYRKIESLLRPFWLYNWYVGRRMCRLLGKQHFDIAVSFMEGSSARMHYILKDVALRNYAWIHCDFERFKWYLRLMPTKILKPFYDRMDGIAAVSDATAEAFHRVVATETPLRTIHNICHVDRIRRLAAMPCERLGRSHEVCIVGRLIPVKGHRLAIDAIRLVRERGVDVGLRIVGTGPLMDELTSYVAESGLSDVVCFTGFDSNPYRYMSVADTVLIASESEGSPMVVIEALAVGRTIVSTDIEVVHELLSDRCGIICKQTPESMADALIYSFDNPVDATAARARADEFSPSVTMSKIYSFIGR